MIYFQTCGWLCGILELCFCVIILVRMHIDKLYFSKLVHSTNLYKKRYFMVVLIYGNLVTLLSIVFVDDWYTCKIPNCLTIFEIVIPKIFCFCFCIRETHSILCKDGVSDMIFLYLLWRGRWNKKSLLLRLSIHLYTLDWSRGDPNGWPAWYWLGSQSRTPCSTLAWQADSYLTTLGFPSKCIPHIERAEWRKHNNLLRSGHQLARIIEKTIRNRISSTRYFEKPKMRGLLQKWFATRLSTA